MADAHALAVSKLLAPFHQSITLRPPGPPLPKGHPSPSLLAKLYLHIASLYSSARSLVKTVSSSAAAGSKDSAVRGAEVIPQLLNYLRKEWSLADTTGRKWLGVEAGENPAGDKVGLAVGWLQDAKSRMEEVKKSGAVGGSTFKNKFKSLKTGDKESKSSAKDRKSRVEEEIEEVNTYLKVYTQMNNTVCLLSSHVFKNASLTFDHPPLGQLPASSLVIKLAIHPSRRSIYRHLQTVLTTSAVIRTGQHQICA